jgi:hypothetical protein
MKMSAQLHVLAALPPKERRPRTHWIGGCIGPRADYDMWRRQKSLAPAENVSPIPQPSRTWSSRYTELSLLGGWGGGINTKFDL